MIRFILLLTFISYSFNTCAQLTYKDVAGIFFSRCTSCHHEGGAGPFPFMNYSETAQEATGIFAALTDNIMPPWSPDTSYTRFLHERIITTSEKTAILNWINGGALAGDTTLAPAPPVYTGFQLNGTPTMELQMPVYTSTATSMDQYVCFSLPTNLTQDQYLRAFEIVPGNPAIVHHVLLNVDTVGNTVNDLSGNCFTLPGDYGLGGFTPGAPPTVFPGQAPLKLGIRIKAGSKIVMQLHYPAGSAGLQDSTKIRLYFYPVNEPGIRPVSVVTPLQNWALFFPPGTVSTFSASFPPFPLDISLLATSPHSHLLCTSLVNYAFNGSDTIPLIRINNWDFEWQGYYNYRNPVRIPVGYTLQSEHVYDNTSNNPNNPYTPPQLVIAGLSTTDEMLFDSFQLTYYLPGDEFIDIGAILATDSLLSGLPSPQIGMDANLPVRVFPNPSTGHFNFRIDACQADPVLEIYSLQGQLINTIKSGFSAGQSCIMTWEGTSATGKSVSAGAYLYVVKTGSYSKTGKIVLMPHTN
ncbi:MAG: T9SS type A sorting domain-containing protein [Bacteroidota bacterium]|nr:T9SS type A sorting domain-containing protein [Bacteroidota bacterium]